MEQILLASTYSRVVDDYVKIYANLMHLAEHKQCFVSEATLLASTDSRAVANRVWRRPTPTHLSK